MIDKIKDIYDWIYYWVTYDISVGDFSFSIWQLAIGFCVCCVIGWILKNLFDF